MVERRRQVRGVRRRLMAVGLVATCASSLRVLAAQDNDDDAPGRVIAMREATTTTAASSFSLPAATLTTECGSLCSSVTGAMACVGIAVNQTTCEATRNMAIGVSCQPATSDDAVVHSVLCLWPEPSRWRIQLTSNAELLELSRNGVRLDDSNDINNAIVLNASDVNAIEAFTPPLTTEELFLGSVDDVEQLPTIKVPIAAIAKWQSLQRLSIRNLDLSDLTTLPPLPALVSLDLSSTRLQEWFLPTAPALSSLDLSSNSLTALPLGSLPQSITVLNVSRNSLTQFPADIESLARLNRLSLSFNNLATLVDFPKLPALQELYLSSCQLASVPSGLANLPMLQILDLSHNNLVLGNAFPATLIDLNLRNCSLQTLPSDFGIAKTWEKIDLSENPFADTSFTGVMLRANNLFLEQIQLNAVTPNIKKWAIGNTLSLSRNPLGAVDGADLPADVAELRLADCFLKEVPPNLTTLARLTTLDLSGNSVGPVPSGSLPVSLTQLFLSGCGLKNVPDDVVAMRGTLQTLDLGGNKLTKVDLSDFASLRRLRLQNNSLASIPETIFTMANLTHLDLRGNPITNVSLTESQIKFLSTRLRTFEIDDDAFAVAAPATCLQSVVLRGRYTLCTKQQATSSPDPSITDVPSNGTSPLPGGGTNATQATPTSKLLNIILACAVAVVMVVSIFVARMPPPRIKARRHNNQESYGSLISVQNRYAPLDMWDDPELLRWRVDILELELVMPIATGANSAIWLARYQQDNVVVKRLHHKKADPRAFERFIEEIKFLGRLVHENVVQFIGVSWTCDSDLQMLLEFMCNGDLQKYLAISKTSSASETAWNARKVRIALDIAEALAFLHAHDPALLHRDLKSHHVLLDEKYTAKLSDFGMCRSRPDDNEMEIAMMSGGRSSRSIAPEVLSGRDSHGKAVDMYAFGVILAELDSHELPFSDITLSNGEPLSGMAMLELLSTGALQPSITPGCPSVVAFLITDCLSFDPRRRPTAADAMQRLDVVLEWYLGLTVVTEDKECSSSEELRDTDDDGSHVRMTNRTDSSYAGQVGYELEEDDEEEKKEYVDTYRV